MNEEIKNKTKEFAQEILESKEYKTFISVSDDLEKNEVANNLLKDFQKKQMELRWKGFDPLLMEELRELQLKINRNEIIKQFAITQNELVELLRRTNDIISLKINMPFTSTMRGGC